MHVDAINWSGMAMPSVPRLSASRRSRCGFGTNRFAGGSGLANPLHLSDRGQLGSAAIVYCSNALTPQGGRTSTKALQRRRETRDYVRAGRAWLDGTEAVAVCGALRDSSGCSRSVVRTAPQHLDAPMLDCCQSSSVSLSTGHNRRTVANVEGEANMACYSGARLDFEHCCGS
jgi:hypothetical protein